MSRPAPTVRIERLVVHAGSERDSAAIQGQLPAILAARLAEHGTLDAPAVRSAVDGAVREAAGGMRRGWDSGGQAR